MMRQSLFAAGAMVGLLAVAGSALAQDYYLPKKLTTSDMRMVETEGERLSTRGPTEGVWSNHATGHSGTVVILKDIEKNGLPCHLYRYTFVTGSNTDKTPYKLLWCKTSKGWKISN